MILKIEIIDKISGLFEGIGLRHYKESVFKILYKCLS